MTLDGTDCPGSFACLLLHNRFASRTDGRLLLISDMVPLFLLLPLAVMTYQPKIITNAGEVWGFQTPVENGQTADIFLGVPYARPPVGDLRFEVDTQNKVTDLLLETTTSRPLVYPVQCNKMGKGMPCTYTTGHFCRS